MPMLFLFPSLLLLLVLAYKFLFPGKSSLNLPPSPPALPIFGNLHQLSSLPHRSLRDLARRHGPVMLIRMGQTQAIVVSSADAAQELFKSHDLAISTRPSSKTAAKLMFGGRNISFAPYGDGWRQAKKLAVVHLLSPKRVLSFGAVRDEEVRRLVERVKGGDAIATAATGREVRLSEILYEYANNVVCHAAMGKETREGRTAARYKEMMAQASQMLTGLQVDDLFPALAWVGAVTGMDGKLDRMGKRFDEFFSGILEEHTERAKQGIHRDEDFVDDLLSFKKGEAGNEFGLEEIEIKAITADLIAAATDTSFVTLDWAMAELMRNPRVMKKLQAEVRQITEGKSMVAEDDLKQMHYLKAVMKEILRLHTPAPILVPRLTMGSFTLQGYHIPSDMKIIINAWAMGRDPKDWENPEEFLPERFIDSTMDYRGNDFQFLPFGAGRRICPGINFAMVTNEIALANLVYHFHWALPDGMSPMDLDMAEAPGLTTPRKNPLRLVATCACS